MSAIISLTTIPSRAHRIEPVLAALRAQGLPVHVWVPRVFKRTGEATGCLPDFFRSVNVEIVDDLGPATKLLPAIQRGFDTIITADDDIMYGEGWADGLLRAAERNPDAAVCYRGRHLVEGRSYRSSQIVKDVEEDTRVNFCTGVSGALYRRSLFGESIEADCAAVPTNDDIAVSAHLRKRGVPIVVATRQCSIKPTRLEVVEPLNPWNMGGANDKAIARVFW